MTINYQNPFSGPFNPYMQQGMPYFPPVQAPAFEQSYIENILRLNRGKNVTVYMSFEGSQWGSKIFKGELLEAGKDHIVVLDNQTGTTYLLLMIYLSYVTFEEPIDYEYPFAGGYPTA